MGLNLFFAVFRLINSSQWREASKWLKLSKRVMKQLKRRLLIQKNRRIAIIRQLHADISQLVDNGHHQAALARVQQLYKDQHILFAYDQVEKFCDCVQANLHDISRNRKVSGDVCEAVSSLTFAASRCGELRELHSLRNLFKRLLGGEFERANVELLPENSVNSQIKHNLSIKSVSEDAKIQLLNEIAKEQSEPLEPHKAPQQVLSKEHNQCTRRFINGIKDQAQDRKFEDMLQRIGTKFCLSDCKNMVTFWSNIHDGSNRASEANAMPLQKMNREGFMQTCKGVKKSTNGRVVDENYNILMKKDSVNAAYGRSLAHDISHVHPKLPDYDDLVAKFTNLKREYEEKLKPVEHFASCSGGKK